VSRGDLSFVNLGRSAYYALGRDGKVLGVLYWTDDAVDEEGDEAFTWYWASAASPYSQHGLLAPPLRHGSSDGHQALGGRDHAPGNSRRDAPANSCMGGEVEHQERQ
jgi:hypothetical protein